MGRLAGWMSRGLGKRFGLGLAIAVGAWLIGTQTGHLYTAAYKKLTAKSREQVTAEALDRMRTVRIGSSLSDFSFEDIDGRRWRLGEAVPGKALICFVSLGCQSCLDELAMLSEQVTGSRLMLTAVVVSSSNPLNLKKMRDSLHLPFPVLWDEDKAFQSSLHIDSYPFNLVVDSGLIVKNVIVGSLKREDIVAI
jgi:peroxiredoxin